MTTTINTITGDNVLNSSELTNGFTVTGASNDTTPGANRIQVQINGHAFQVPLLAGNTWTKTLTAGQASGLGLVDGGTYEVDVLVDLNGDGVFTLKQSQNVTVD